MAIFSLKFFGTILLIFLCELNLATDTMSTTLFNNMSDGTTLVSKEGGTFELGFFTPGSSRNRYLGIWYKNIPVKTYVWVANRERPMEGSSGVLTINSTGHLVLLGENSSIVWSAEYQREAVKSAPILELLDTGNLVLREADSEDYLWQSFDHPSDTLLPGMKLGWDLKTGLERRVSSWKSSDDPSIGDFTWGVERGSNPELVMWKGSEKYYRSGPWNGKRFTGAPDLQPNPLFDFEFVSNDAELYYRYHLSSESVISRIVMNQTNYLRERYTWSPKAQSWNMFSKIPRDYCDSYGLCGAYGNCIIGESPVCLCLKGFARNSTEKVMDWSEGCARNKPLKCEAGDKGGFVKLSGLKLPDTKRSWVDGSLNLGECRSKCLNNCSCTAYANTDIRGKGKGCAMWFGNLIDIRQFSGGGGQDMYLRLHSSELEQDDTKVKMAVIALSIAVSIFGMLLIAHYIRRIMTPSRSDNTAGEVISHNNEDQSANMELPLFDLPTIANATNHFSSDNKIGEGGYGPVYKGILEDGQEIAVKRLSKSSGQGLNEFKNEVALISKLQHRNLVRLLGCSIQGDEKLLIYEYMPNKSLDSFIFDQTRSKLLDWPKRFNIISGIARGLLYLHQDSRLRIIHRDLKASNVLLDNEMIPKISDFGMARTVIGDQSEGNTNRVVGTYGYMAPEYAIDGLFSPKSDVFSYGILLLEIITGMKNRGFYHLNCNLNLIGHAWKSWKEGRPLELIDPCLEVSNNISQLMRSIHVGLLCVQEHPEDRPSMSDVVVMLSNSSTLPQPKQPGFSMGKNNLGPDSSSSKHEFSSTNGISVSILEAR